jgi:hypothetical protein
MYGYPGYAMPMPMVQAQPVRPQPMPGSQPTPWQASGNVRPPAVVRGVAPEAPPLPKFVLPRPEALGVATSLSLQPTPAPPIDWQGIQVRMERVGVVGYRKECPAAGVVRVTLVLRTTDPSRRQPVTAQGETEAAAVLSALQYAEAWAQQR